MTTACDLVEVYYSGDGVQTLFPFNFYYLYPEEIQVALLVNAGTSTAAWQPQVLGVDFQLVPPLQVEFLLTAPPAPTTAEPNVRIRRVTNISQLPAVFEEGSTIRAQDLNDNFETVQQAIEEVRCKTVFLNDQDGTIADALQELEGDVATNTANIATNAANIATNTGNIATNTANIAANAANIAINTANIATNTANIADNTSDIADNAADIADIQNNPYQLPIASDSVLGGIKVGSNLSITADGTLSATGGAGGGVTKIVAGNNVTISPGTGVGDVTINAVGGGGGGDSLWEVADNYLTPISSDNVNIPVELKLNEGVVSYTSGVFIFDEADPDPDQSAADIRLDAATSTFQGQRLALLPNPSQDWNLPGITSISVKNFSEEVFTVLSGGTVAMRGPVSIGDVGQSGARTPGKLFLNSRDDEDASTKAVTVDYGDDEVFVVDYTGKVTAKGYNLASLPTLP